MKRQISSGLLISLLFFSLFCTKPREGAEPDHHIFVFADSLDWVFLKGALESTFEKTIRTPQLERLFVLVFKRPETLAQFKTKKNIILLSSLRSQGKAAEIVRSMLTEPRVLKGVEEGRYYVFTLKNQWAQDQLLMVLVSKDLSTLKEKIIQNSDFLYRIFDNRYKSLLKKRMYAKLERKETEKKLMDKYGWAVRVQHDYFLAFEDPKENFVFLRRRFPERWLFVYWVDTEDPSFLTPEWCLKKRDEIGEKFYGEDRIVREYTRVEKGEFLGREALIVEGLWENEKEVAGGPYKAYCFYDPPTKRVYMIDIAVFAPGQRKMPFLRQLEVIAHTFRTHKEG